MGGKEPRAMDGREFREDGSSLSYKPEGDELRQAFIAFPRPLEADPRRILRCEKVVVCGRERATTLGEAADYSLIKPRQPEGLHAVIEKGFPAERKELAYDLLADRLGIAANLQLGMRIHPQGKEVEEIVEVDLPVGLGVGRQRQILPRLSRAIPAASRSS